VIINDVDDITSHKVCIRIVILFCRKILNNDPPNGTNVEFMRRIICCPLVDQKFEKVTSTIIIHEHNINCHFSPLLPYNTFFRVKNSS
jgi:hypothetical protein